MRGRASIVVAATAAGGLLAPASAVATPQILSVKLDRPAVPGRAVTFDVRAADRSAAVTGLVASFGNGEAASGLSACRLPGSSGRAPGPPFRPGSAVRLSVPHTFGSTGARPVALRVDAGGCEAVTGSVVQPITVTPTPPGQEPVAPILGTPVEVPKLPAAPQPVGGGGGLPLAQLPALPVLTARAGCPGAARRIGRSHRARRRARRRVVCLLNLVRRSAGLRRLRQNRRLSRAAGEHSGSMVRRRYFAHVEPGGIGLVNRLKHVRYIPRNRAWGAGENIAFGSGRFGSPVALVRAWMASTPHRANILTRSFREVGLGVAVGVPLRGMPGGATLTSDFGYRR
jgi:uncharacterized protein YkwD